MHEISPKRVISLIGKIDEKAVENMGKQILDLWGQSSDEWVTLLIGSWGGSVQMTFGLFEFITKVSKLNLQTISLGATSSMAPVLLVAGQHRVIGKHTRMLFHSFSKTYEGTNIRLTTRDLNREAKENIFLEKMYVELLSERSGGKLTSKVLRRWIKDERIIGAEEAISYGLAHEILRDP